MVALAVLDQVLQGVAQGAELLDLAIQLAHVLRRQGLDVGTGTLAILPEGEQLADFVEEKPRSRERRMNARVCRSFSL